MSYKVCINKKLHYLPYIQKKLSYEIQGVFFRYNKHTQQQT